MMIKNKQSNNGSVLILSKEIKTNQIEEHINGKMNLFIGLSHLLICLLFLIVSSYLEFSMWLICLICAISLIVCIVVTHVLRHQNIKIVFSTIKRLPYELIIFVISMFIIVLSLNEQGITSKISSFLGESHVVLKYGISSFVASNLINNIPMSVLFSTIPNMSNNIDYLKAIYSTIIGSNIGAFLTPMGALAGIMFTDLISRHKIKFGFLNTQLKTYLKNR